MKKTVFTLIFSFAFLLPLISCASPETEFDQLDFILDESIQTTYDAQKYYICLLYTSICTKRMAKIFIKSIRDTYLSFKFKYRFRDSLYSNMDSLMG